MQSPTWTSLAELLDGRTLYFIVMLSRTAQAFLLIYLWRVKRQDCTMLWALASVLFAISWLFVGITFMAPQWITVLIGNGLSVVGTLLFNYGIIESTGERPRWRIGIPVAIVSLISIYIFYFAIPSTGTRILIIGLFWVYFDVEATFSCFSNQSGSCGTTYKLIGYTLCFHSASVLWRTIDGFALDPSSIFFRTLGQIQFPCMSFIFAMVITTLLCLLMAQKLQDHISEIARHDHLTNALNRRAFNEVQACEWTRAKRHGHPISFLMIDIDHFKSVNDRFGHGAGDCVLAEISGLAQSILRPGDVWCRYGGEEFALLLPETSGEQAVAVAERLRELVATASFSANSVNIKVTISVGVADGLAEHSSMEPLMQAADRALYCAKSSGRNRVVYDGVASYKNQSSRVLSECERT